MLLPYLSVAQSNRWKRTRYEFFGGIGMTNMLSDLGGADQIGTHGLKDFNFSMTRPAFTVGGRYWCLRRVAVCTSLSYGWLRGDDRLTAEYFRENRNIQERTTITEWQTRVEYTVLTEKEGHRYNLRKMDVRGLIGNKIVVNVFGGAALFYYVPKGRDGRPGGTGKYYALRSVGTEGQNFVPTRKPYSPVSVSIPLGFQLKYIINRKWSVSWDIGIRQTFTDYLDDVSKTYVDPNDVATYNKNSKVTPEQAAYFADPSLSKQRGSLQTTGLNQQRGNSANYDIYFLSFFTVNYKVRTGRNGLPTFK